MKITVTDTQAGLSGFFGIDLNTVPRWLVITAYEADGRLVGAARGNGMKWSRIREEYRALKARLPLPKRKEAILAEKMSALSAKVGAEPAIDLTRWYAAYHETGCPNCGVDFRTLAPENNLYPHYTGACVVIAAGLRD